MKIDVDDAFVKWAKKQDQEFFEICSKQEEKEHLELYVNEILAEYAESNGFVNEKDLDSEEY